MSKQSSKRKRRFFTNTRKVIKALIALIGLGTFLWTFFKGKKEWSVSLKKDHEIAKTQFPVSPKTGICDVVVGLDFGTSCTKVFLRTPYLYNNRAFPVPFTDLTPLKNAYLLPSKLWLKASGEFLLREEIECQCFNGIKLNLIEECKKGLNENQDDGDLSSPKLAVAYLSLVLRFAREWFLSTQKNIYGNFRLRWHANLGVPAHDYDTERFFNLYKRILHSAWILSLRSEGIRSPDPSNAFEQFDRNLMDGHTLDDVQLNVIPEVAALVSGYARSPLRDPKMPGLHLLVDIGAGTLDICGFVLHQKEGDDRCSLLTTDVQLLGVIKLHENRLSLLNEGMKKAWDPYDPEFLIPSDLRDYLPPTHKDWEKLHEADKKFSEQCQKIIKARVHNLRTKRDPYSSCWKNSLPVFMCGGGSNVPFYQEIVRRDVSIWLKKWLCNEGLDLRTLPRPENLELELSDDYHRLAVAWGLSMPADDIVKIDPTQKSEDIDILIHPPPDLESRYISKDMV